MKGYLGMNNGFLAVFASFFAYIAWIKRMPDTAARG
jgi:hypothetical protein